MLPIPENLPLYLLNQTLPILEPGSWYIIYWNAPKTIYFNNIFSNFLVSIFYATI